MYLTTPVKPGRGELVPANFPIPFNPITLKGGPATSLGEILRGKFIVPYNPLARTGLGACGDCGCFRGCTGLGQAVADNFSLENLQASLSSLNWTTLGLVGGGLFFLYLLVAPGGAEYRRKSAQLRSQYRGYRRVSRRTQRVLTAARG